MKEQGLLHQSQMLKPDVLATAVLLLHEQYLGDESEWKWFLDTQPKQFPAHPLRYGDEEIRLLDGTQVQSRLASEHRALRKTYKAMSEGVEEFGERHSWDQFLHAYLLVTTRSFVANDTKATTMAPYVDMLNHQTPANAEWVFGIHDRSFSASRPAAGNIEDYASGFILYIPDPVQKGEQLFISYGPKTNEQLLRSYGFMLDDNIVESSLKYKVAFNKRDDALAAVKQ